MHALVLMLALAQAPEVESMKAFRGADGQVVEVVTLKPRAARKLLVRVKGSDTQIDGLVVPCTLENEDAVTVSRGAPWNLVVVRGEAREVFVPGTSFKVKFDQAATDAFKAAELSSEWNSPATRRAMFARREWPVLEKKYQAAADGAVGKLTRPCGHAVAFSFDWSSFPDAVMAEANVWRSCEGAVAEAQKKCPAKLICRGGAAAGVTTEGDALVFTTVAK